MKKGRERTGNEKVRTGQEHKEHTRKAQPMPTVSAQKANAKADAKNAAASSILRCARRMTGSSARDWTTPGGLRTTLSRAVADVNSQGTLRETTPLISKHYE